MQGQPAATERDRAATPNEIGEHLHLTSGTVTTVIDSLEKRSLVERQPYPEDRRKVLVSITDAGRAVLGRYLPEAVAIQTAMLGSLNDDELQTLNELLTRALRSTDGIDPHAVAEAESRRRSSIPMSCGRSRTTVIASRSLQVIADLGVADHIETTHKRKAVGVGMRHGHWRARPVLPLRASYSIFEGTLTTGG